ncbi:uncharacterized protein LOC135480805 [Liolophura sinensis]|uniref:uncharacterized protein LOC135480805 n=1 Tax=Liolophura sinensis TaxID=3198878 RepID=UPI0031597D23
MALEDMKKERQAELKEAQKFEKEVRKKIKAIDKELEEKKSLSETALLKEMDPQKIDWLKISAFEFDGRWDSVACQQMWTNVLTPAINRSKWLKEENDKLLKLVNKYNKRNWPKIAQELGTNRTPFQCLQHYEIKLNTSSHMRTWTPEEEALLLEVVATCRMGNNIPWTQVSFYMEDKSASSCQIRYNQMDPTQKRGRWSADEDALLLTQIHKYGPQHWALIADAVPNRTSRNVGERWSKALNPSIRLGQWSYDEDKLLLTLMKKEKNSCARVAQQMTGRTNSQIRKRYNVLKRWEREMVWLDHQSEETREFLLGRPPNIVLRSLQNMLADRRRESSEDAQPEGAVSEEAAVNSSGKENPKAKGEVGEGPSGSGYKPNKTERRDLAVLVQCSSLFYDYLRQQKDRQAGELVVPRPLVSKHSTRRCIQRLKMKEKLREAVLHRVGNTREELEEAEEGHDGGDVAIKDSTRPVSALPQSSSKTGLLKSLHPSMTVREILEVTRSIAEDRKEDQDPSLENQHDIEDSSRPVKKKGRKSLSKLETSVDYALRQTLICQASAFTPLKKHGRRRRYFPAEESCVHLDPEKRRQCEARTASVLMKALKVDGQAAWTELQRKSTKSKSGEVVPVTKQDSIQRAKESLSQMREFGFLTTQTTRRNGDSQQAGTSKSGVAPPGNGGSECKGYNSSELPALPPSWTTLAGFRALKLGLGGLVQKSANCSESQIFSLKRKRSKKGDSPKDMDHHDEVVLVKNKDVQDDPLSEVRKTEEFRLLQSRFNALFLWPTFLSCVPLPQKQTASQLVEEQQEDEGQQKRRRNRPRKRFNPRSRKKTCSKKTVTAKVKTQVNGKKTSEEEEPTTANQNEETTQTGTMSGKSSVLKAKDSVPKRRRGRREKLQQPTEKRRTSTRLASKCKLSETSETHISEGLVSGAKGGKSSNSGSAHNDGSEDETADDETVHNRILSNEVKINSRAADESVKNRTLGDESVNSGNVGEDTAINSSAGDVVRKRQISNSSSTLNLVSNSESTDSVERETQPPESKKRKRGRPNKLAVQKN